MNDDIQDVDCVETPEEAALQDAADKAEAKSLEDIAFAAREEFHKNASQYETQFMEDLQGFGYLRVLDMLKVAFPFIVETQITLNADHPEYPA